ncbi:MAG: hypothetical protein HF973_06925, partial [Chloroflexi bacterium]|nr:hypothetical protein [Chloroflexota bacterium]
MPTQNSKIVCAEPQNLIAAIKRVMLICSDKTKAVEFEFTTDKITLLAV